MPNAANGLIGDLALLDIESGNVTRIAGDPAPFATPSGLDPLALIEDEHYRRTRLAGADPHDRNNKDDDEEE